MAFYTGLSGLNAAAKNLAVTGNNIANANTAGFKQSRAEFADVYAASISGVSKIQPGSGVRVTNVAQQFTQGNINATGNNLDLAISGEGFFSLGNEVNSKLPSIYTRSGEFKLDKDGYVVNNQSNYLMAFKPNGTTVAEGFSTGVYQPLRVNAEQGSPVATTALGISANLQSVQKAPTVTTVDPKNPDSYNHTTSMTIYDSQGNSHIASTYFVSQSPTTSNAWNAYLFIDAKPFNVNGSAAPVPLDGSQTSIPMTFDTAGKLTSPLAPVTYGAIASTAIDPNLTVSDLNLTFDFTGTTQYSSKFAVNNLTQDGFPSGNLSGINVDNEGVVFAKYSNGNATPLGKVALARFANPQGLAKLGDTTWAQSADSGERVSGEAGTGNFGVIQSGSVEAANVDLSEQLVNLIIGQQAYQANAQTISTENTITQTILNIR
jgi:flagellar hook protein FlgE